MPLLSTSPFSGGIAGGGTLPPAAPQVVGSEAELRGELERAAAQLAPTVEWTARVDALLRVEGLVKGGAASWPAFPDLLAALLRDPLAAQVGAAPKVLPCPAKACCCWLYVVRSGCLGCHPCLGPPLWRCPAQPGSIPARPCSCKSGVRQCPGRHATP